jgi:hypothetical protein
VPHDFGLPFLSEDSDLWESRWTPYGYAPLTRKRRNRKKVTLAGAIKEAQKAGVVQGRVTVGGVSVEFGKADFSAETRNPWDEVLSDATH